MYTLKTPDVLPNMVLYEDTYTKDNKFLLPSNTILTKEHIHMLEKHGFRELALADLTEVKRTRYEHLLALPHFQKFQTCYLLCLKRFTHVLNNLGSGIVFQPQILLSLRDEIISHVKSEQQLLDYMYYLTPTESQMTYTHCFNAGLLVYCFAKWCHVPKSSLDSLTIAGFLFDCGLIKVDRDILNKADTLSASERDRIGQHIYWGYELTKSENNPRLSKLILTHHERTNGFGYPFHLYAGQIDPWITYIAMADLYESMTHIRSFRLSYTPFQALTELESYRHLYPSPNEAVQIIYEIAASYLGRRVALSDGSIGKIVEIHTDVISRPVVYTIKGMIDLKKYPNLEIVRML